MQFSKIPTIIVAHLTLDMDSLYDRRQVKETLVLHCNLVVIFIHSVFHFFYASSFGDELILKQSF